MRRVAFLAVVAAVALAGCRTDIAVDVDAAQGVIRDVTPRVEFSGVVADVVADNPDVISEAFTQLVGVEPAVTYGDGTVVFAAPEPVPVTAVTVNDDVTGISAIVKRDGALGVTFQWPSRLADAVVSESGDDPAAADTMLDSVVLTVTFRNAPEGMLEGGDPTRVTASRSGTVTFHVPIRDVEEGPVTYWWVPNRGAQRPVRWVVAAFVAVVAAALLWVRRR